MKLYKEDNSSLLTNGLNSMVFYNHCWSKLQMNYLNRILVSMWSKVSFQKLSDKQLLLWQSQDTITQLMTGSRKQLKVSKKTFNKLCYNRRLLKRLLKWDMGWKSYNKKGVFCEWITIKIFHSSFFSYFNLLTSVKPFFEFKSWKSVQQLFFNWLDIF